MPKISAYGRPVESPFGLLGTNENALTFALGYTLARVPSLLRWFLAECGVKGLSAQQLQAVTIELQKYDRKLGITDIEVRLPGRFHIIVEAKVGLGLPQLDQVQRYMGRLADEPIQRIITLAAAPDELFVDQILETIPELAGRLTGMAWFDVLHATARLLGKSEPSNASRQWLETFYQFLDREYSMQAITTEVWLVAAGTEPLWRNGKSFWNIHQDEKVYFDTGVCLERPLYIAFRASGVVEKVYRVEGIEQGIPIVDRVPDLANVRDRWPREKHTIWHLADPVALPREIRTGPGMYNRRVRCDFDLLLLCSTVREIEDAMRERRQP